MSQYDVPKAMCGGERPKGRAVVSSVIIGVDDRLATIQDQPLQISFAALWVMNEPGGIRAKVSAIGPGSHFLIAGHCVIVAGPQQAGGIWVIKISKRARIRKAIDDVADRIIIVG